MAYFWTLFALSAVYAEFIVERRENLPDTLELLGENKLRSGWIRTNYFRDLNKLKKQCRTENDHSNHIITSLNYDSYATSCYTENEIKLECSEDVGERTFIIMPSSSKTVKSSSLTRQNIREIKVWGIKKEGFINWQTLHMDAELWIRELKIRNKAIEFVNREKWDGLLIIISSSNQCLVIKFTGARKYPLPNTPYMDSFINSNLVPTTKVPVKPSKKDGESNGDDGESNGESDGDSTGIIIAVVFVVFLIIFLGALLFFLLRRKRRRAGKRNKLTSSAVYAKCEVDIKTDTNKNNQSDKASIIKHQQAPDDANQYESVSNEKPQYHELESEQYNRYDLPIHKDVEIPEEQQEDSGQYCAVSEVQMHQPEEGRSAYDFPDVKAPLMEGTDHDNEVDYYSTPISDEADEDPKRLSMMYAKVNKDR